MAEKFWDQSPSISDVIKLDVGITSSSLLKNPRHGERVVIQFSVTNRRRLACGAHL